MLSCERLTFSSPKSIGGNMSIRMALVLQELPETMAKLCGFFQALLVSLSEPEEEVNLSSDMRQPDEVAKWSLIEEKAKITLV